MEVGNRQIELVKKHLSTPGPFERHKGIEAESKDNNRKESSHIEVREGIDLELNTDTDAI